MLKALELSGFKSFADRTRFEFPPGITVVVGPNGSGKSNIVDAIKWALGAQSAKSLRGKDMADVIFKGTSSRKAVNTAEATIIFDNADGRLPVDAPEVHVTRRVYRSGEGEYLINRAPCRLKDVRDLFRGTGAGTDAYSLIEQGKVDRLLQASPRDRRAIFEEAAGISRFKAKKVEAQRRLERVEQNLLRLSDIVDEVESRLRSVRSQASKARRYREYTQRLQQLRTRVALADWRKMSRQLELAEGRVQVLKDEVASLVARCTAGDARSLELETSVVLASESVREREHRLARNQEQLAGHHSLLELERGRVGEWGEESRRIRGQLAVLTGRADDAELRLQQTRAQCVAAEQELAAVAGQLDERDGQLQDVHRQLETHREQLEQYRGAQLEATRQCSTWTSRLASLESEQRATQAELEQCTARRADLCQQDEQLVGQLEAARGDAQRAVAELQALAEQLEAAELELAEHRRLVARRREEQAMQQGRLNGVQERASLLEELEQRQEGLTAGVQQVLALARRDRPGPFAEVLGLVADAIDVPVRWAPLVDCALGPRTQHVILAGDQVLKQLAAGHYRPSGRVGFIRLEPRDGLEPEPGSDLGDRPGVVGRLDQLVQTPDRFQPLIRRLLGDTWAVEQLPQALELRMIGARRVRFVTLRGELLELDGTVTAGPKDIAALVSRRSELRQLHREQRILAGQIQAAERELRRLEENIDQQQVAARRLLDRRDTLNERLADCRVQIRTLERRETERQQLRAALAAQSEAACHRADELEAQAATLRCRLTEAGDRAAECEALIEQCQVSVTETERRLRLVQQAATAVQVERAKREQQLEGLRTQVLRYEEDRTERARATQEAHTRLFQAAERIQAAERVMLRATSELAELYLEHEALQRDIARLSREQAEQQADRGRLLDQLRKTRRELDKLQEQLHAQELAARQVQLERTALATRIREDYEVDIAQLEREADEQPAQQSDAVEEEIAQLRRKISNIGAVNMEALNELDDLESRYEHLSGQHQDLQQAKQALERIIHKINADSRRLFMETLEAIRQNFQVLYRRAFGGGKADLVLEEGIDVLECGIEIVATPPGKPSFSNSLLSGGERALTAVALLMAIFQYRPSPFCVLDEVDAPFDEANIGRFVDVLRDFLQWTKFVLVTHSKKTMTAATTLYGVTMQESGVSKQVSVRFEDVSEDGQISDAALERAADAAPTDPAGGDERGAA